MGLARCFGKKMSTYILTILHTQREKSVSEIVEERGFVVENDPAALIKLVTDTITSPNFEKQLAQYKEGDDKKKGKMQKVFFGKVMAASRGMADADALREALEEALEKIE